MTGQKDDQVNSDPIDILLVDDNEDDIEITLRAFQKAKIKNNIFVVQDGQEALDFIYHQGEYQDQKKYPRPDIILLDINMPKMDGYQVLKNLKENEQYNIIPIIMLTSSKDDEDIVKSYKNGAVSYIQKPVKFENFLKFVDGFNFYWHIVNKLPDGKYR